MHNFSNYIYESINSKGIGEISSAELDQYIQKVQSKLPRSVQDALYLTKKYNLLSSEILDEIKSANKSNLAKLSKQYKISNEDIETLNDILNGLGTANIKLLPQYQCNAERESLVKGKIKIDDVAIDLVSSTGRSAVTNMYMPMVYKIVNQYTGKSKLGRDDLISVALEGFTNALNEYRHTDENNKSLVFKTYASYRVQQAILNEINTNGHTLSGTSDYAVKKFGAGVLDAVSIDGTGTNDEGDFKNDRLASLGEEPEPLERDEEKEWKQLYDLIEGSFKQRDVNIFYRYFGIHGYKREKSKDIAKSLGMSEGNIRNSVINKVINFLKRDKRAMEILSNIQDMYNESLMCSLVGCSREVIIETLVNDDMFILLEELNRWNNKEVFLNTLQNALNEMHIQKDHEFISMTINGDTELLGETFKDNKKSITHFLRLMYPTENISRKSDETLLEYMSDIQRAYKKYKIQ